VVAPEVPSSLYLEHHRACPLVMGGWELYKEEKDCVEEAVLQAISKDITNPSVWWTGCRRKCSSGQCLHSMLPRSPESSRQRVGT
jgi:hypothetical protein